MKGWKAGGTTMALAAVLVLGGCGSDEKDQTSDAAPESTEQTTEPTASSEPTESTTAAGSGDAPDLCDVFSADDFQTVTGEAAGGEPETQSSVGVIQSSCTYSSAAGFPMVMLGAYDASGFDVTVESLGGEPVELEQLEGDGNAYWTDSAGIIVGLDGQDWYLQVVATGAGMDYDKDLSTAAAEIVLDNID